MFKSSIEFLRKNDCRDKYKYEIIFNIVNNFKKEFDFAIRNISEFKRKIWFSFEEYYSLAFDLSGEKYYVEIETDNDSIEDFKEKYEFLCRLIYEEVSKKY